MRPILSLLFVLALPGIVCSQVKKPEPPPVEVQFDRSLQAVVVTTNGWDSIAGTARLFERKTVKSEWKPFGEGFPVVVGRSGLAWGEAANSFGETVKIKQEGDGNSPAGLFPLTTAFGTSTKPSALTLPYTKLEEFTECVDDVQSNFYNRIVNRMQVGNYDWKSSEKMLTIGPPYELGVVVAYNSYPVERGRGSCIFLHIWRSQTTGTAGCTAMERRDLEHIVAWLSPAKNPYLVQMPADIYDKRRKEWNLPKLK